jgi:hypothetical protein
MKRRSPVPPALVVALVALFVSIGGIGYAATKIGTSDIQNGAVTTKKIHDKAVTSKKIKGSVPSAKHANDANTVTGMSVQKIFFKAPASTSTTQKFSARGLTLNLGCDASIKLIATVSSASSQVALQGESSGDATPNGSGYSVGSQFTNQNIVGTNQNGSGRLTYSTAGGAVVTMVYGFDNSPTLGGQSVCTFRATAISG